MKECQQHGFETWQQLRQWRKSKWSQDGERRFPWHLGEGWVGTGLSSFVRTSCRSSERKNGTIRAFTRAKIKSISAKVCFEQSTIYASLHCEGSFSCSDRRVETTEAYHMSSHCSSRSIISRFVGKYFTSMLDVICL